MSSAITLNNQTISIDETLRAKSGGIIKISEFAQMRGLVINKETRRLFDSAKREFYTHNRKALALASADQSLDVTKVKFVFKKPTKEEEAKGIKQGEFMGLDMSCRLAAEAKAGPSEDDIIKLAASKLSEKLGCTLDEAISMLK